MTRNILCFILAFAATAASASNSLTGTVTKVRDGDTIEVAGVPVRLDGVNAPETGFPLGMQAKDLMADMVLGQQVTCQLDGTTTYDRVVGVCFIGGTDIGAEIIRQGLATDCPRYSGGRYTRFETKRARNSIQLPGYCR